ncbi:protein Cep78 homolog [Aethina tumida]|uniref:protein Cep78 homolog n=1 Tax=Aethina tumida TaxID=116153 RepID=UPI002148CB7D|nr:protein Cep78 homolog [Aethina tumida]
MTESAKSSARVNTKPVNVFYVWYAELCRRLNSSPAPIVKPTRNKCKTVLDFVADRLKLEDWSPVINALRHDTSLHVINIRSRISKCAFLHDVDTEEKAKKLKRKYGTLWTAYILKNLLRSLSCSIKNTQVLTCLELDGLPLFSEYLEPLLQALKKNGTVKSLSFSNCPINDLGCELVCSYLRYTPNVEIVNLSAVGLTPVSGKHLAKLIKFQQINRYCESWHRSLRYENPNSTTMRGIKRISLNRNEELGDEGVSYILNELEDDLWIKALDLQKCGITEQLANKIIDLLAYAKSLEIIDLRQNEKVNPQTINTIFQILKDKQSEDFEPEYQWCNTAQTISFNSLGSSSDFSLTDNKSMLSVHKMKLSESKNKIKEENERDAKSVHSLWPSSSRKNINEKNKIRINPQVIYEPTRRKKILEIKKCLNDYKNGDNVQDTFKKVNNFKTIVSPIEKFKSGINSNLMLKNVEANGVKPKKENSKKSHRINKKSKFPMEYNGTVKTKEIKKECEKFADNNTDDISQNIQENGVQKILESKLLKASHDHKNGINGINPANGFCDPSNLFEKLMKSCTALDDTVDEDEGLLNILKASEPKNNVREILTSQTSLIHCMDNLEIERSNEKYKTKTNHPM